jgi:hypothetical protein
LDKELIGILYIQELEKRKFILSGNGKVDINIGYNIKQLLEIIKNLIENSE